MANLIGVQQGSAIVWAGSDYVSTATGLAKTSGADLTLANLLFSAARQGVKQDMATIATTANANRFLIFVGVEFKTGEAPVDGETVGIYWAGSPHATAGNANPGGTSGADADYTGSAGGTLAASLLTLQFIGALSLTADAVGVVQYGSFVTTLPHRYGMPVVVNNSVADDFNDVDGEEFLVAAIPLEDEAQ